MNDALAVMLTITTHGTSLSGEERRCVEQDVILPAEPLHVETAPAETGAPTLRFSRDETLFVGKLVGTALNEQLHLRVWALTVQIWYAHLVVEAAEEPVSQIVQCAEEAVQVGLERRRPIWAGGYDKRYSFDDEATRQWIAYVERHNVAVGLPPRPWPFIEAPDV